MTKSPAGALPTETPPVLQQSMIQHALFFHSFNKYITDCCGVGVSDGNIAFGDLRNFPAELQITQLPGDVFLQKESRHDHVGHIFIESLGDLLQMAVTLNLTDNRVD